MRKAPTHPQGTAGHMGDAHRGRPAQTPQNALQVLISVTSCHERGVFWKRRSPALCWHTVRITRALRSRAPYASDSGEQAHNLERSRRQWQPGDGSGCLRRPREAPTKHRRTTKAAHQPTMYMENMGRTHTHQSALKNHLLKFLPHLSLRRQRASASARKQSASHICGNSSCGQSVCNRYQMIMARL